MVLWVLLTVAAITDIYWGKIFNVVNFSFLGLGLLYRAIMDPPLSTAFIAITVAFALTFPFYLLKAIAAGDAKLLMAYAAWTDYAQVIHLAAITAIIGGMLGGVLLIKNLGFLPAVQSVLNHLRPSSKPIGMRIPFGPAFLCGFIFLKIAEMKGWEIF